ncbi:toll/interleukin-1 receptor domain-containing protein [Acidipropionibacterium jensenii]|uniref:toll/interleukin-1 receptor domain-containing protein n=1 Tax=Acidipropionibacterium jensenii TaxID=1749 RepID=UPI00214BC63A|nr:toll/interleukin-1 receptor domain-containing protein [Acidipropionibacterium jensenii]
MALTKDQRFALERDLFEEIESNQQKWPPREVNLLLDTYGCSQNYTNFEVAIANLTDVDLISMCTATLEHPAIPITPQATAELELDITPIWTPGMVRVFLSHSAIHKKFASEVAAALAPFGITGFVAHESMTVDHNWQDQIRLGLRTMDAFVILLHTEVNTSNWCQQEIGWAQGANKPLYLVRLGADPSGFIGSIQYPRGDPDDPVAVAEIILQWLTKREDFSEPLVGGLLSALEASTSFIDSIAIASNIAQLDSLTDGQWERLDKAVLGNDQVKNCQGACNKLRTLYRRHKRQWPSAQAELAASDRTRPVL